jgi:hypothetical protein
MTHKTAAFDPGRRCYHRRAEVPIATPGLIELTSEHREFDRRCEDTARLLAKVTDIGRDHVEYYSALKRYRLHDLLNRVIRHCYAGFKFHQVQPLHPEDVDGWTRRRARSPSRNGPRYYVAVGRTPRRGTSSSSS